MLRFDKVREWKARVLQSSSVMKVGEKRFFGRSLAGAAGRRPGVLLLCSHAVDSIKCESGR